MEYQTILQTTETHYSGKIEKHGPTFKGVDWGYENGQNIRFEQLLKPIDVRQVATIIDYGCGYGALLEYLDQNGFGGAYTGYDISPAMIRKAKELHKFRGDRISFTTDPSHLKISDVTLASGIFNVKLKTDDKEWCDYILYTLDQIAKLSRSGFVFNVLSNRTPYSLREDDLFYADPDFIFDYCTRKFSKLVTISHDYPLPDFTVSVRFTNPQSRPQ
jgi:SAM-dependent methyltransferase